MIQSLVLSDMNQQLLDAFLEYLVILKGLSKNTIKAYIQDLTTLASFTDLKHKSLLEVDSAMLVEFLSTFKNKRTQNRKLSSINIFYNFCHKQFNLQDKPKSEFAKLSKNLPKYLEYTEIQKSLSLIDTTCELGMRDYALILFLYASGIRVSELISIKKSDVSGEWLTIRFAKNSKQRVVPLAKLAIEKLKIYLDNRTHKSDYLWLNFHGKPLSRIAIFNITKKYSGVSPHVFRHSFATSLILGGADLLVVSELLGHSNITTTQIYTHIKKQHLEQTINKYHPMKDSF